jgi:formate/nitrite transporter
MEMKVNLTHLTNILLAKTQSSNRETFKLAIMAGIYISIGAICYGLVTTIGSNSLVRFLAAISFTIGLILVIFKKAQLFTGNNLLFINLFAKNLRVSTLIKNWSLVYLGNFLGAVFIVFIMYILFKNNLSLVENLQSIALKKTSYSFFKAFSLAILCNMLVCTAVILGLSLEVLWHRLIGIIIPITLFVFLGFEHSIANMFFIPLGLGLSENELMKILRLFAGNIIPVTLGNVTGGLIISLFLYYRKD